MIGLIARLIIARNKRHNRELDEMFNGDSNFTVQKRWDESDEEGWPIETVTEPCNREPDRRYYGLIKGQSLANIAQEKRRPNKAQRFARWAFSERAFWCVWVWLILLGLWLLVSGRIKP
jgi:hypothetical protein